MFGRSDISKIVRKSKLPTDEKKIIVHNLTELVGIIVHNLDRVPKDEKGIIVHNLTDLVSIIVHNFPKDNFLEAFKKDPVKAIKNM